MSGVSESRVWQVREYCVRPAWGAGREIDWQGDSHTDVPGLKVQREMLCQGMSCWDLCFREDYSCDCGQNRLRMGVTVFWMHGVGLDVLQ